MRYRVYDTENKCWVKDNIYMTPDGELFTIKKSFFGLRKKLVVLSQDRYVYHEDTLLEDKNGFSVYVGDYLEAKVSEDRTVTGLVAFAYELSAYVILCVDCDEFFTLGSEVTEFIRVIGNVFDGYEGEE